MLWHKVMPGSVGQIKELPWLLLLSPSQAVRSVAISLCHVPFPVLPCIYRRIPLVLEPPRSYLPLCVSHRPHSLRSFFCQDVFKQVVYRYAASPIITVLTSIDSSQTDGLGFQATQLFAKAVTSAEVEKSAALETTMACAMPAGSVELTASSTPNQLKADQNGRLALLRLPMQHR